MIKKTILHPVDPVRQEVQDVSPVVQDSKIIDEELLIRKTFIADPQAGCRILFQKYYQILCSHAVRFVQSREVAEDIVGEIFCKIWTDQLYLSINTSYRAYLFKAVRHSAYNYVRWELARRRRTIDIDGLNVAISANKPEQAVMFNELAVALDEAIDNLPPQCKKVFIMSRFDQKKNAEIAAELGISLKAVEANITRALDSLRKSLEASGFLTILLGSLFS